MDRDRSDFEVVEKNKDEGWFSFESVGWGMIKLTTAFTPVLFIEPIMSNLSERFVRRGIFGYPRETEKRNRLRFFFRTSCYYGLGFSYAVLSRIITCSPRTFGFATTLSFSISAVVLGIALFYPHKYESEGKRKFQVSNYQRTCSIFLATLAYAIAFLFYAYVPNVNWAWLKKMLTPEQYPLLSI